MPTRLPTVTLLLAAATVLRAAEPGPFHGEYGVVIGADTASPGELRRKPTEPMVAVEAAIVRSPAPGWDMHWIGVIVGDRGDLDSAHDNQANELYAGPVLSLFAKGRHEARAALGVAAITAGFTQDDVFRSATTVGAWAFVEYRYATSDNDTVGVRIGSSRGYVAVAGNRESIGSAYLALTTTRRF